MEKRILFIVAFMSLVGASAQAMVRRAGVGARPVARTAVISSATQRPSSYTYTYEEPGYTQAPPSSTAYQEPVYTQAPPSTTAQEQVQVAPPSSTAQARSRFFFQ